MIVQLIERFNAAIDKGDTEEIENISEMIIEALNA